MQQRTDRQQKDIVKKTKTNDIYLQVTYFLKNIFSHFQRCQFIIDAYMQRCENYAYIDVKWNQQFVLFLGCLCFPYEMFCLYILLPGGLHNPQTTWLKIVIIQFLSCRTKSKRSRTENTRDCTASKRRTQAHVSSRHGHRHFKAATSWEVRAICIWYL